MFKMIVQELRQYAWLSDGWRRTATAAQRSTEILPDRIEYCVMLMEVLRNALSCEFAERIKFARVNANLTCVAELIWLLPQCGEFITKADLAEMDVSEETGGEDGGSDRATSGVDAEQSKSSFGGSTMVAVDEISEVELEKLAAEIAAEKSAVMGKLNDRARANLSYMTDLCSSVLYNLLYLVEQSEAGGTRLTDRLLTRMFENAQEEWVRCYSSCMWNHLCVCGGGGGDTRQHFYALNFSAPCLQAAKIMKILNRVRGLIERCPGRTNDPPSRGASTDPGLPKAALSPCAAVDFQIFCHCEALYYLLVKCPDGALGFLTAVRRDAELDSLLQFYFGRCCASRAAYLAPLPTLHRCLPCTG